MGLMVLDRAPAADDLLEEDLDLAALCSCACGSASHDPEGCRACLCPATWDGLGAEDQDDEEQVVVARVVAALKAARARQKRLLEDRAVAVAKDPTRLPRSGKRKPDAEPKAPRKKKVPSAAPSPLSVEHSRASWLSQEDEVLEEIGAL